MAEYDRDLVSTIADSLTAYVRCGQAEEAAGEVLTDLEANGWQIRHPNDSDVEEYEVGTAHQGPYLYGRM